MALACRRRAMIALSAMRKGTGEEVTMRRAKNFRARWSIWVHSADRRKFYRLVGQAEESRNTVPGGSSSNSENQPVAWKIKLHTAHAECRVIDEIPMAQIDAVMRHWRERRNSAVRR